MDDSAASVGAFPIPEPWKKLRTVSEQLVGNDENEVKLERNWFITK